jgi:ribosomal protein S18 acetylase RimI-like enzyme
MIDLDPPYRRATPEDAGALARLINYAGEGLPLYLWTQMAEAQEDPWEVGRRRARREEGAFSYRNAIVAELDGEIVACLIGYPLPDLPELTNTEDMPPLFVPLQELEDLAPGTWYLNVLATDPARRGQGHGSGLLALAERIAARHGKTGVSIIVSDANAGARRLYERWGCHWIAHRPMVKEAWDNPGRNWVLLFKPLDRPETA